MSTTVIDLFVKASALLAAAALTDALLRRRASAATRHLVWTLAIAALLALPLASLALPRWQVQIPVERAAIASAAGTPDTAPSLIIAAAPVAIEPVVSAPAPPRPSIAALAIGSLALVYFAGVLLLLARLAVDPISLRRLTRESRAAGGAWTALLRACVREMGVGPTVRLLISRGEVMPLTFGTRAPAIVLPASAETWTDDRRRAVLLHELAHIARRDCLLQRVCAVACAIYWPHPGVWLAARRLRIERELACDDRVLIAGAAARDYAGHLLELAHSLGRAPAPATALGMARARHLERRLLAILDAARNRATPGRRGYIVALGLSIACLLPVAALRAAVVARVSEPSDLIAEQVDRAQASPSDLAGTWDLRLSRDGDTAQVSVRTERGNHGRTVRLDQLPGISRDQIASRSATVQLPIVREAGTFNVDGSCRSGVCAGTFTFNPSSTFAAELARRGLGRPTPLQQMDMAIADIGVAYLDALTAAGYPKPTLELLVRAAQHGVSMDYLRGMTTLGYRAGTLDALIQLRDHGVDPDYIRGMETAGYSHLTAEELRNARDHGADPVYAREMAALGFRSLPLGELINARDHGVDQVYVRDMQAIGFRLTLQDYVKTRDHGVDPAYARDLASLGYGGLDVAALVGARDHGVDPAYVRGMAELGYKGVPLGDLIRMRDHGVDPDYVRRVQRSGIPHLSVDGIIQHRDRGEPDPDAAVRAVANRIQYYLGRLNHWLHG